ncbi:MAG: NUDIX hydrolase [Pseudomonadota bacterium]
MNMLRHNQGKRAIDPTAKQQVLSQVAALCTRSCGKGLQVLLVQSSRGRWILPKGWPMDDRTDAQAAKLEAWEEAGVAKGAVDQAPVATFMTKKRFEDGTATPCLVSVYPMDVKSMAKEYPEAGQRRRRWVSIKKAIKLVDEDGLKDILRLL